MTGTTHRAPRATSMVTALLTFAATVVTLGLAGSPALAHTDFDSSTPADGEVVDGPVDQVTIRFTNPATESGDGFVVVGPDGEPITPLTVDPTDGTEFVLTFDPALESGPHGVRWEVRAGDAHPISGTFRFEVAPPAAGTVPTTSAPTSATADDDPAITAADTTPPDITTPDTTTPTTTGDGDGNGGGDEFDELDAALAAAHDDGSGDASTLGRIGRSLSIVGAVLGLGAPAAAAWVVRGRADEIADVLAWVRLAGLAVAAGGVVELAWLQVAWGEDIGTIVGERPGIATVLKIAGGSLAWIGFAQPAVRVAGAPAPRPVGAATVTAEGDASGLDAPGDQRWEPSPLAGVGVLGYLVVVVSFWFDGHTVSVGPWALHSLVNLVHVVAAAAWAGGVVTMTALAWRRHRRGLPSHMAAMVVRFSTVATVSLVAVIAAGAVMAVLVLDRPGDLVATEWGRLLIAKTVAVAIAAAMGAYNHLRLRPALQTAPDDPALAARLRTTLAVESAVFAVILGLTVVLVAASTS